MSVQSIPGSFSGTDTTATIDTGGVIAETYFADGTLPTPNIVGHTAGAVRVAQVQVQPTLMQSWTILGWTIRADIYAAPFARAPNRPIWSRLGQLWAGLAVDANLSNAGGTLPGGGQRLGRAAFPLDVSTFAKVWDGADPTPLPLLQSNAGVLSGAPGLIAQTFMLPAPQTVRPGTQLQMVLILTPSLLCNLALYIPAATYTILYEDGGLT